VKTLLQAAIEFERHSAPYQAFDPEHGAPNCFAPCRDTFMAGAAAMAEIFANSNLVTLSKELAELTRAVEGKK
jgi:hypothetical protein